MYQLNILTSEVKKVPDVEGNKVTEADFWKAYLMLLNIKWDFFMSEKEVTVFSVILSLEPEKSYFTKPHNVTLKQRIPNLSLSELSRVKKRLLLLEVIEEHPHPKDKRKNITLPVPSIIKLQKFIKTQAKVSFVLNYEFTKE